MLRGSPDSLPPGVNKVPPLDFDAAAQRGAATMLGGAMTALGWVALVFCGLVGVAILVAGRLGPADDGTGSSVVGGGMLALAVVAIPILAWGRRRWRRD